MKKGFYLVGGYVRDKLLNLQPQDRDYVAVGYVEAEMLSLGFRKVGADFPVFLHPKTKDEYALPRKERSTGLGYNEFSVTTENVSLEDDLMRRDLTINAMALSKNGNLIDPFNGLNDLNNKLLRHTSDAFKEDPVRVLRLARFTARFTDFKIHPDTIALVQTMRESLSVLKKERVFKEFEKALKESKPQNFFYTLSELGVLDIIFPEIHKMIGIMHNNKYHAEGDVFEHTMRVLAESAKLSSDPVVRFAALYHDIAKPITFLKNGNFHGHDEEKLVLSLLDEVKERYKVPNKYIQLANSVAVLHQKMYKLSEMKSTSIVKLFENKFFPKTADDLNSFLIALRADVFGRILSEDNEVLSREEADLLFESGVTSFIKNNKLFVSGKFERSELVNENFMKESFTLLKNVSPAKFIEEYPLKFNKKASVDIIKQYIYLSKNEIIKKQKKLHNV